MLGRSCHTYSKENLRASDSAEKSRWNDRMCELCESSGFTEETKLAMRWYSWVLDTRRFIMLITTPAFDVWNFSLKKSLVIFSSLFLFCRKIFHLIIALNCSKFCKHSSLPPFCQQSQNWPTPHYCTGWDTGFQRLPWDSLLKSWPIKANCGIWEATVALKNCSLPCIIKQWQGTASREGKATGKKAGGLWPFYKSLVWILRSSNTCSIRAHKKAGLKSPKHKILWVCPDPIIILSH